MSVAWCVLFAMYCGLVVFLFCALHVCSLCDVCCALVDVACLMLAAQCALCGVCCVCFCFSRRALRVARCSLCVAY